MPVHHGSDLAAFQSGESRLVYARWKGRPTAPLYYLEDGSARDLREWTKRHLECFMPDCQDRRLTTVSRTTKRDGFSHYSGSGGHSPEGLFHQQSKALIVRWLAQTRPELSAVPEEATPTRSRRADVMVTWPDGSRVAIEIQYAGLTPEEWRTRHHSYLAQGITPIWLLGHLPPHLRVRNADAPAGTAGRIEVSPLIRAMLAEAVNPLWVNPIEEKIGACWVRRRPHRCLTPRCTCWDADTSTYNVIEAPSGNESALFGIDSLWCSELTRESLLTPTTVRLAKSTATFRQAVDRDTERQAAEQQAWEKRARERLAALAARQADEEQRRQAVRVERRDEYGRLTDRIASRSGEMLGDWMSSDLRRKVIDRYGEIPEVLRVDLPYAHAVFAHPEHWHAALYGGIVLRRPQGAQFGYPDCERALAWYGIETYKGRHPLVFEAVRAYLMHLHNHGVVRVHSYYRTNQILTGEVVAALEVIQKATWERERHDRREEERRSAARLMEAKNRERVQRLRKKHAR